MGHHASRVARLLLVLLLALAILPYAAQRWGLDAGRRAADGSPIVALFSAAMLGLLALAYTLARRRALL